MILEFLNYIKINILKIIVIILCSSFIISCGYIGLLKPDKNKFPSLGIDVSHHQNEIDWKAVANQVDFVFIKATEGSDFIDDQYKNNSTAAIQYKIPYSAYHFFTFCSSGENQALNYIQNFELDTNALPPVIDLEFLGKCNTNVSDSFDVVLEIKSFLDTIENHYKKIPIIYTTYEFYNTYLLSKDFDHYHYWIRDLFKEPKLDDNRTYLFWQYSNCGKLNGIEGNVDMNVFKGNKNKLINLK